MAVETERVKSSERLRELAAYMLSITSAIHDESECNFFSVDDMSNGIAELQLALDEFEILVERAEEAR